MASLREDYLSQVQRDFLSRIASRGKEPAPLANLHCDAWRGHALGPHSAQAPVRAWVGSRPVVLRKAPDRLGQGVAWPGLSQSKTGDSTPSTLCSFGLVVVYCSSTRFSGNTIGLAPKAASAAS